MCSKQQFVAPISLSPAHAEARCVAPNPPGAIHRSADAAGVDCAEGGLHREPAYVSTRVVSHQGACARAQRSRASVGWWRTVKRPTGGLGEGFDDSCCPKCVRQSEGLHRIHANQGVQSGRSKRAVAPQQFSSLGVGWALCTANSAGYSSGLPARMSTCARVAPGRAPPMGFIWTPTCKFDATPKECRRRRMAEPARMVAGCAMVTAERGVGGAAQRVIAQVHGTRTPPGLSIAHSSRRGTRSHAARTAAASQ